MARKPAKKSRKRTTSNARKPHAKPSPEPAVVSVSPDLLDPLQRAAAAVDPSAMSEVGHVRYATFVESTDPRVTICEAWKALMQFRHELLTNPRQDSGAEGWWSVWVGTMQRWLYGGGDWGYGYYGPSHRITTPDCAVGRNDKTRLFPANTTYAHNGFVIDWGKPFPPIPERGPIVEWVESWIDRIQYTEATGRYPWEPDAPPTPTVSVSPDLLAKADDGEYRPATWFRKGMANRLRQAASKQRKTKRVATRTIDGVVCYSVADVRRWWPSDVPKEA
jgi:hypothetical protein